MKYLYFDTKPQKRFFIFHSFDDGGRTIQVAMERVLSNEGRSRSDDGDYEK